MPVFFRPQRGFRPPFIGPPWFGPPFIGPPWFGGPCIGRCGGWVDAGDFYPVDAMPVMERMTPEMQMPMNQQNMRGNMPMGQQNMRGQMPMGQNMRGNMPMGQNMYGQMPMGQQNMYGNMNRPMPYDMDDYEE